MNNDASDKMLNKKRGRSNSIIQGSKVENQSTKSSNNNVFIESNNKNDNMNQINLVIDQVKEEDFLESVILKRKIKAIEIIKGGNANLLESMSLDNTNHEILFKYLQLLLHKKTKEFTTIFQWKKIFLTQDEIKQLVPNDFHALNSSKEILKNKIFLKAKESIINDEWLKTTKALISLYSISNPYVLRLIEKKKIKYIFTTSSEKSFEKSKEYKVSSSIDLRPNCPMVTDIEESIYRLIINELNCNIHKIKEPTLLRDLLLVIEEISKKCTDINEMFNQIYLLLCSSLDNLPYSMKYTLDKIKSTLAISPKELLLYESIKKEIDVFSKYIPQIIPLVSNYLRSISRLKCITTLIRDYLPENADLHLINNNFIESFFRSVTFHEMFNQVEYGFTEETQNKVYINTELLQTTLKSFKGVLLFQALSIFITLFHEAFGHYIIRYLFYYTNGQIDNKTDRKKQFENDGGDFLEGLLFSYVPTFDIDSIVYLFTESNWDKNYIEFKKEFCLQSKIEYAELLPIINEERKKELIKKLKNNKIISSIAQIIDIDIKTFAELFIKENGRKIKAKIDRKAKHLQLVVEFERKKGTFSTKVY